MTMMGYFGMEKSIERLRMTGTPDDHDGLLWHGKVQREIAKVQTTIVNDCGTI